VRHLAHSEHNWGGYFAAKAVFHTAWNPPPARGIRTVPSKCSCTCSLVTSAHVRPRLQSGGQFVRNSEHFRYVAPHAQLSYRTRHAFNFASNSALMGTSNNNEPFGFRFEIKAGERLPLQDLGGKPQRPQTAARLCGGAGSGSPCARGGQVDIPDKTCLEPVQYAPCDLPV